LKDERIFCGIDRENDVDEAFDVNLKVYSSVYGMDL